MKRIRMSDWQYRILDPQQAPDWDQQALRQGGSSIYMHSLYLDEVAPHWGYLENAHGMRLPIWRRKRWGMYEITHPLFVQHFRPIHPGLEEPFDLHGFLKALEPLASRISVQLDLPPAAVPPGWQLQERVSYRMPLPQQREDLWQLYSSHHKRILKKDHGLQLAAETDLGDFTKLFLAEMPNITGLKVVELEKVIRLMTWISIKRRGQLFTARREGQLVAACFILHSGSRLLYQWAVSSAAGKELSAMHHLIAHVLGSYVGSDLEFDFEGSMLPGLQRFYAGFGAKPYLYMRLTHNRLPFPLNRLLHVG
jgi:hypothetical protein